MAIPGVSIMGERFAGYPKSDRNLMLLLSFLNHIFIAWYFFQEFKAARPIEKAMFGCWSKLAWKLPIGLAVLQYLVSCGTNPIVLYILSFIAPKYVYGRINYELTTIVYGWFFLAISALIYAPIMEDLFFRGIMFQKIAVKKNILSGILISAIAFALIPISLFGIVSAILYFKTKQLYTPIIYHFTYNFIVLARRLYSQFFGNSSIRQTTILEYQEYVRDSLGIYILLLAISVPYLSYFIYKNLPRDRDIDKLPYFVNQ